MSSRRELVVRPGSKSRRSSTGVLRRNLRLRPQIEDLEVRITPAVVTWSGATSSLWSVSSNWVGGIAPSSGDDLVFPSGASNLTMANDFANGTSFGSITINGAGYDLTGDSVALAGAFTSDFAAGTSLLEMDVDLSAVGMSVQGGGNLDVSAVLSGVGGVTVDGGSTLTLDGMNDNTYTGVTTVNNGVLNLQKMGAIALAGDLVVGDGTDYAAVNEGLANQISDTSQVSVNTNGYLNLQDNSDAIGSLNMTSGNVNTGVGVLTLNGGLTSNPASNDAIISGLLSLPAGPHNFDIQTPNPGDTSKTLVNAVISGVGDISKVGGGTLFFTGNNGFSGSVDILAGRLTVTDPNALGSSLAGTMVADGATLEINGGFTLNEPLTILGSGVAGVGAIDSTGGLNSLSAPITLNSNAAIGVAAGNLSITSSIIDNGNNFSLTKVGPASLGLVNTNYYGGGTSVVGGTVQVTNSGALGSGQVTVNSLGELDLSSDVTIANNLVISGTGVSGNGAINSISGTNVLNGSLTLGSNGTQIQVGSGQLNVVGTVGDGGDVFLLLKTGPGQLVMSGSDTSLGTTQVDSGPLYVAGIMSGGVGLNGGDVFGTGSINGGITQLGVSTGNVVPGDVGLTGVLGTGGLQLSAGTTTSILINGTTPGTGYSQLVNLIGNVDLSQSTLNVTLANGFIPAVGDTFRIIDNTTPGLTLGNFAGLSEGSTFSLGNVTFQISYSGGDGNDVVLTVTSVLFNWTGGGGDSNWSTASNWDVGIVPTTGSDLVFPSGAARLTNNNDLVGGSFHSLAITGAGYQLNGNAIALSNGVTANYGAGTSTIAFDVSETSTESIDVAASSTLDMDGGISGTAPSYGLTKTGAGVLRFGGSTGNTYAGTTTVNGGTLSLAKPDGVISLNGAVNIGDGVTGASVNLESNNQIWDGSSIFVNEGSTFLVGGYSELISALTLEGSVVQIDTGGALTIFSIVSTQTTTNNATSSITGAGALVLNNSAITFDIPHDTDLGIDLSISASIQGVGGGLQKVGAGTLALAGLNTYTGQTAVNSGILFVQSSNALGAAGPGSNTIVSPGASVQFLGTGLNIPEDFDISGPSALFVSVGDTTITGGITLSAVAGIGAQPGTTLHIAGSVSDVPSTNFDLNISNIGTGRTVLSGDNSYFLGNLQVNSGFLQVASDNALGDPSTSTNVILADTASFDLSGGITLPATKTLTLQLNGVIGWDKVENLSGDNTIQGPIVFQGNMNFMVAHMATLLISGQISESNPGYRLFMDGPGTLNLLGPSNYTGTTYLSGGLLSVNSSIASSSDVQILGGTLGGAGSTPQVTVMAGGAITPGNSPGILSTGNVVFNAGSAFNVELNGTIAGSAYDQLAVNGTVSLGNATLNITLGYVPIAGDTYTIINNDSTDPVNGTFNSLPEGATVQVGNQSFTISYVGGDGNDVTLTALPRLDVWSGLGISANWTDPNNWVGGVAPSPSDNLSFPVGAAQVTNTNDFASGTLFGLITIASLGYDLSGNMITLNGGVTTTYTVGGSSLNLDLTLAADATFDIASTGVLFDTGSITGSHLLIKNGGGTLALAGSNGYTSGTFLNDGVLGISNNAALGSGPVTIGVTGRLDLSNNIIFGNAIVNTNSNTGISSSSGFNTLSGPISLADSATIDVALGSNLDVSGIITQMIPTRSLTKTGAGYLALDTTNLYDGGTDVKAGTLAIKNMLATGSIGQVTLEDGATLIDAVPMYQLPSGGLSVGSATVIVPGTNPGYNTLSGTITLVGNASFEVDAGSLHVPGVIGGSGTLTLAPCVGFLFLEGNNNYTGQTFVQGGMLAATGSITSSSQVNLINGSLLSGNYGDVVATGGIVNPNFTPTMNVTSINYSNTTTSQVVVNDSTPGNFTQIVSTGAVSLNDAQLVAYINNPQAPGTVLTIIDNQSALPVSGTFAGLAEGAVYNSGSGLFVVSYMGGDGNDVTLTSLASTTTTVSSNVINPIYGQSVTLTAVVAASGGTATGTVTFLDNGSPMPNGVVTLVNVGGLQVASLSTFGLSYGSHIITAEYSGATNFQASSGALLTNPMNVLQAITMTLVAPIAGPVTYGDSVTVQASVTSLIPSLLVPTGSIAFYDGDPFTTGVLLATQPMDVTGSAQFTTSVLTASASPHTLMAVYIPDDMGFANSSSVIGQSLTVNKATLTVQADNQSRTYGDPNPTLTYQISGFVNGEDLGTSGVTGTPDVTTLATPSSPVAGSPYSIDAAIGSLAAGNYDFSFVPGALTINTADLTITANNQTMVYGQPVPTLTATYQGFKNGETPADLETQAVLSTTATSTSPPSGNPYPITVEGASSPNYNITFVNGTMTVTSTQTTTTLSSPPPTPYGQPVVIVAQVTSASPGTGSPTGQVRLSDGSTDLGLYTLTGGKATITLPGLAAGFHTLTATYLGNGSFQGSSSGVVVVATTPAPVSVALAAAPSVVVTGQSVNLVASLTTHVGNGLPPTGVVSFYDNGIHLGDAPLVSGHAAFAFQAGMAGYPQSLYAIYRGDARYQGAISGNVAQTVQAASTQTMLTSRTAGLPAGRAQLTAFVTPITPGAGVPAGQVVFYLNRQVISTATLVNGAASLVIPSQWLRSGNISAVYLGTSSYLSSRTAAIRVMGSASYPTAQTALGLSSRSVRRFF